MKTLRTIILLLALFTSAFQCTEEEACCMLPTECQPNSTLSGKWELQHYEHISTGEIEKNPDKSREVVYTFEDDRSEGKIEGQTFVNTVMGSYSLGQDCSYQILGFGGSKVGEPAWSNKAWLNESAGHYQISDEILVLTPDKALERLVFRKKHD